MKRIFFVMILGVFVGATGCKKFSAFQTDPNKTSTATPDLLLNTVEQQGLQSTNDVVELASRMLALYTNASPYNDYGWTRGDYSVYDDLRQVVEMEQDRKS